MVYPDNVALAAKAHRAEPDVRMMYELFVAYVRGTLKPASWTKITHYFSLQPKAPLTNEPQPLAFTSLIRDIDLTDLPELHFSKCMR
jgi:hypothetical protein